MTNNNQIDLGGDRWANRCYGYKHEWPFKGIKLEASFFSAVPKQ